MIRGQLCLYEGKTDVQGWAPSGGVGIVEAPIGSLIVERILGFIGMPMGTDHLLAPVSYAERPVQDAGHEVAQHLTNEQWPRPAVGSGMAGGGLLFRRTRAEASSWHEILLVAICMYAPAGSVRSQMRYAVEADEIVDGVPHRMSMRSPTACDELSTNGVGMTRLLKLPAWGWSDEPFGFVSTLRLDVIDQAMESMRLLNASNHSSDDLRRIEEIKPTHGYWIASSGRRGHDSADFAEYRRRLGTSYDDWSSTLTATQMRERELKSEEIIKLILAERD